MLQAGVEVLQASVEVLQASVEELAAGRCLQVGVGD